MRKGAVTGDGSIVKPPPTALTTREDLDALFAYDSDLLSRRLKPAASTQAAPS